MRLLALSLLFPAVALAQGTSRTEFSVGLGAAFSAGDSVSIHSDTSSDFDLDSVAFTTKPFEWPPYYTLRVSRWNNGRAWEVEFIHYKLSARDSDLNNRVEKLDFSDGYNLLYLNYAHELHSDWNVRFGVGAVIPRPDVIVDGVHTQGGYQLAGITSQMGLEKEFLLSESVRLSIEGKMTYSYARIDLDNGYMTMPDMAVHLVGQFKYSL